MADEQALAAAIAREAGALLRERFGAPPTGVGAKSSRTDLVSDADRAADALVVGRLRAAYPTDAVISEEGGELDGTSGRTWLVDPLDGTINYLYGLPHWAVSVACRDGAGILAAAVYDPIRDELFSAARGQGATLGTRRLVATRGDDLGLALVATGFSYRAAERTAQAAVVARLAGRVRDLRRGGSAALDLAWVAAGRLDAYFEVSRSPWDSAAGELLVREAGGRITWTEQGEVVASGAPLHDRVLVALRDAHQIRG